MGKKTVRSLWLCFAAILALALVAMACGGEEPAAAPTPTPAPTLSPVRDVQTICLKVEQSYPQIEEEEGVSQPIAEVVRDILAGLGLQVVAAGAPCDATLTFDLTGEALEGIYLYQFARLPCYTGAEFSGQMTFTVPGQPRFKLPISESKPPISGTIYSCPSETGAPFGRVWPGAVLDGLAHLWPPTTVFAQALGNEEQDVRAAAAEALGKIGPEEGVVPLLIQTLEEHEDGATRRDAAEALGKIGPAAKAAVPALIQTLEKGDKPGFRAAAAEALGKIGPEEGVVPALIQALGDENSFVRGAAADALGEIGPAAQDAVLALIQALGDEDEDVRAAAERALNLIR